MTLKANSNAKINLSLHIVGKRTDGYHLLESVFAPVDMLFDEIELKPSNDVIVEYNTHDIENDIVQKTTELIQNKFQIDKGAHFNIKKNIPISAGLGGGSSNSATAIKLLNKLWSLNLTEEQMIEIGLQLGADVPFFIKNTTAFVEGIGETISPIKLEQNYFILLVNPKIDCCTKAIFDKGFKSFENKINKNRTINFKKMKNSLTENAYLIHPEIKEVINFLEKQKGVEAVRMSGSGATCFGLFKREEDLIIAKESLPKSWWHFSQELIL